jgi:ketosteroid isomerase-like protein
VRGAGELLKAYAGGWLASDVEAVLALVTDDVVVVESHGPTYRGAGALREWLENWVEAADVVHRWDLGPILEASDGTMAAAEWEFACTAAGRHYEILGASVVEAADGRLTRITEYRREVL